MPTQLSYWLRVQDNQLRFFVDDGSQSAGISSPTGVADGQWHHVAAVLDHTANELPEGSFANSSHLLIGAFNSSSPGVRRFNGDIDTVRISMGALTSDEFLGPDTLSGDFDGDGDVDGRNFLAWQRGESPQPGSAEDLADWTNNYGTANSLSAAVIVPEPTSAILVLVISLLMYSSSAHCWAQSHSSASLFERR